VPSHSGLSDQAPRDAHPPSGDAAPGTRLPIDIRRLPWIRRLAADYAYDFARLSPFFSGNPEDPAAWRDAIARTQRHPRQRERLVELLHAQQRARGAHANAIAATSELADPQSVAIVTGQQAGLFGGPMFTLLKALTAVRLAERVRSEQRVPAVAIFWIDAEDHDWDEVKTCRVFDPDLTLLSIGAGDPPGAHDRPVARVQLDDSVAAALGALESALPPTEFTPGLLDGLRAAYRPGMSMVDAFARWLEHVLGERGLIVFDSSDRAAKPLVAPLFAQELEHPGRTSRLAAEAGARLAALDYHVQVSPQEGSVALFHLNDGRHAIKPHPQGFQIGDSIEPAVSLIRRVTEHPEAFSPNVLLRPLVQDTLFPTACYVAGPSELAYLAQLHGVYEVLSLPMPLIYPRTTATIVDTNAMRFLTRHEIAIESLRAQDEAALNELLESLLPPSVEASLEDAQRGIQQRMDRLAQDVQLIDATLEGATRSTLSRMQDDLKKLNGKIIQAAKRKDETLRRQFNHARSQAFPAGEPQEREVGFVYFLNKYGPAVVDRLSRDLPLDSGMHWVVTI
jgi:bacillithiol synthase